MDNSAERIDTTEYLTL